MHCLKISLWALVCCCALLAATSAEAIDFKVKGLWQFRVMHADRNLQKNNSADKFRSANRLRTKIHAIASESLEGVVYFTIGHQNWGNAKDGAALGTDSNQVRVDNAYIDWAIPNTTIRTRVGLQPLDMPYFTDIWSPIISNSHGPAVIVSDNINEHVSASFFWLRIANDNAAEADAALGLTSNRQYVDNMDFWGMSLPLSWDGFKITPWGMYGSVGKDSFKLKYTGTGSDVLYNVTFANMLPLMAIRTSSGVTGLAGKADKAYGDSWFAGLASMLQPTDSLRIALDATYGSVDMGSTRLNGRNFDLRRYGWFAALQTDYILAGWTPGFIAYYASGDDGNPYNGSERMPALSPDTMMTSYGFDGTWYSGAGQTLGFGLSGTWAFMGRIKDVSFVEDMKHTLRVVYYGGTNSPDMVKAGAITNPQSAQTNMFYLTTSDHAWEVNLDTTYKIYENLLLAFELGYIRLDMDKGLWDKVGYKANENNWKVGLSASYMF